jgi:hypothetical protein
MTKQEHLEAVSLEASSPFVLRVNLSSDASESCGEEGPHKRRHGLLAFVHNWLDR